MILSIANLSKSYRQCEEDIHALKNISFEVNKGETLSIVGPSGSGKTTLLTLLAGLDHPSTGRIEMVGEELTAMDEEKLSIFRSVNMGIIFQQFHLIPYMSAIENVSLPLEITGGKDITPRAIEALTQVGLKHRQHHRPDEMSGGERQRVAIARALIINPQILLADEPSGNLDTETGEIIMDLMFDLVKQKKMTLVLVTHDIEFAGRCQKIIKLKAGHVE